LFAAGRQVQTLFVGSELLHLGLATLVIQVHCLSDRVDLQRGQVVAVFELISFQPSLDPDPQPTPIINRGRDLPEPDISIRGPTLDLVGQVLGSPTCKSFCQHREVECFSTAIRTGS
jgi:hypothetical protein